jgi:filamentous hemagglutinin family protein
MSEYIALTYRFFLLQFPRVRKVRYPDSEKQINSTRWRETMLKAMRLTVPVICILLLNATTIFALPTGGTVVSGGATITQPNSVTLNITQTTDKAVINWQSYNIGQGESVHYLQPGSSSVTVLNIVGSNSSSIVGNLIANGSVWIINPNGMTIGSALQAATNGLVLSSYTTSNADYTAGKFTLTRGDSSGNIRIQNPTEASKYLVIVAPQIINESEITVTGGGKLILAAGNKVTVDMSSDAKVTIDEPAPDALIDNKGTLTAADGGEIILAASNNGDSCRTIITSDGVIQTSSLFNKIGKVILSGDCGTISMGGTFISGDVSVNSIGDNQCRCEAFNTPIGGLVGGGVTLSAGSLILTQASASIVEGSTVTLNAGNLTTTTNNGGWVQVSGPIVTLSSTSSSTPTFVAPPVTAGGAKYSFEYRTQSGSGTAVTYSVTLAATDNGITGFPSNVTTFKSATGDNMGIRPNAGALTGLSPIDPATLTNETNKPANMLYGVVDMEIKVSNPGDTATVTVFLPSPAPAGYKWFKYSSQNGWYDFSDHAVFNGDRTQVTLTLVDGGIGDDDGIANGVIKDPSGLGEGTAPSAASESGGGGGHCFIATAAYGSALDSHVSTLRAFRDRFLLTHSAGRAFVAFYYEHSPALANYISRHDGLRAAVRVCLLPLIGMSWVALNLGSFIALFVLLLLLVGTVGLLIAYRRNWFMCHKTHET